MRERFGASNVRSMMCRFHVQTAGSSLTAQSVDNNVVRTTIQALAAVLGGAQSLHTNARDEALALPTEEAARLALRTQQILAYESGVAETPDPLAGSYYVESLTERARGRGVGLPRRDRRDGRRARGDRGAASSSARSRSPPTASSGRSRPGDQVVVGVNRFRDERACHAADPAHRPGGGAPPGRAASGGCAPSATRPRGRPRMDALEATAARRRNLLPRDHRRGQGLRHAWARSATASASRGASTAS